MLSSYPLGNTESQVQWGVLMLSFPIVKGEGALDKHLRCRNVSCGWSWRLVLESAWSWLRVRRERFMVRGVWCCSSRNRKQALVSVNDLAFVLTLTLS